MEKSLKRDEQHIGEPWNEYKRNSIKIIRVAEELEGRFHEEPIVSAKINSTRKNSRCTVLRRTNQRQ